jgi:hypothetical protein|tara:strand:+ start:222 stop:1073 length:852 start_codon:yes stop_codon:yes gene_type:complete
MKIQSIYRILPLLNIGTYHGSYDPSNLIDDYLMIEDFEEGHINYTPDEFWSEGFDNGKYTKLLLNCAGEVLEEEILPVLIDMGIGIKGIKVTGMDSPREYNFRDDWLEFYLEVQSIDQTKDILIKLFKEQDLEDMNKFFKKNYGSYDGFTSFMSYTSREILEGIEAGQDDEICQFIYYLMIKADLMGNWNDELFYRVNDELYYWDFLDDDFVEKYKDFGTKTIALIQKHYVSTPIDGIIQMVLAVCKDKGSGIKESDVKDIVIRTIKKIEDKTLNLFQNQSKN